MGSGLLFVLVTFVAVYDLQVGQKKMVGLFQVGAGLCVAVTA